MADHRLWFGDWWSDVAWEADWNISQPFSQVNWVTTICVGPGRENKHDVRHLSELTWPILFGSHDG